ncbi:LysR family transcriptional regulator [Streptomyces sp. NPDC016469]|uniref:LysR family transcriptional regulator n=1 Tax=Streptomyces sp. NPDC016469 TaxID=3157191 RepID=UPI0033FD1974
MARYKHISRAAQELRVAQPSVSRTISRPESELGVRLFDRQGRRIRRNDCGVAYLGRVDKPWPNWRTGAPSVSPAPGSRLHGVSSNRTLTKL